MSIITALVLISRLISKLTYDMELGYLQTPTKPNIV